MLCFKRINKGLEVGVYHHSTTSLISTRQRRLSSGETPPPSPSSRKEGKQYFYCALLQRENPVRLKKNNILIYLLGRWRPLPCPSRRSRCSSGSSLRGCPAASRLSSLPGEEGGWSVGRSDMRLRASARWANAGGNSWTERRDTDLQRAVHKRMI